MLFHWKKNRIEKHKDNEALIKELKIEGIKENNILQAIKKVPREIFVEQQFIQQAYKNIPLPIDCGQTISQPYVVAYMTTCLNLKKTDGTTLLNKIFSIPFINFLLNLIFFEI